MKQILLLTIAFALSGCVSRRSTLTSTDNGRRIATDLSGERPAHYFISEEGTDDETLARAMRGRWLSIHVGTRPCETLEEFKVGPGRCETVEELKLFVAGLPPGSVVHWDPDCGYDVIPLT